MGKSLWDKLTGTVTMDDQYDADDGDELFNEPYGLNSLQEAEEGELAVDVYDTGDAIIIKTMTAGVKKSNLDIEISRETVTIRGERHEEHNEHEVGYHHRELYWGSFSRTIDLPDEVDIDHAEASEEHGLVTLVLPKVNKTRKAQIKIK